MNRLCSRHIIFSVKKIIVVFESMLQMNNNYIAMIKKVLRSIKRNMMTKLTLKKSILLHYLLSKDTGSKFICAVVLIWYNMHTG